MFVISANGMITIIDCYYSNYYHRMIIFETLVKKNVFLKISVSEWVEWVLKVLKVLEVCVCVC